jgi:hypothetical protein
MRKLRGAPESKLSSSGTSGPLRLPCPHCKTTVSIPRDLVNQVVECAHCDQTFKVETESARQQREPQPTNTLNAPPQFLDPITDANTSFSSFVSGQDRKPSPIATIEVLLVVVSFALFGAALGFFISYWFQPGLFRAFCSLSDYVFRGPRLLAHIFEFADPVPGGPFPNHSFDGSMARTMIVVTLVGALISFPVSIFVAPLYARRSRGFLEVRIALLGFCLMMLACLIIFLALAAQSIATESASKKRIAAAAESRTKERIIEQHDAESFLSNLPDALKSGQRSIKSKRGASN